MSKRNHDKRQRRRKQATSRAIKLAVEALEPRLVLSAVGLGFDGARERLDFHQRDQGHRDVSRPAFAAQYHGVRDGGPAKPFSRNFAEPPRHGGHFDGQPRGRLSDFGGAEGESTSSPNEVDNSSPPASVLFVAVTITTSAPPARGGELIRSAQPATTLLEPPRTSTPSLVNQQGSSATLLPATAPLPASLNSRINPSLSDGQVGSVLPAGESAGIATSGVSSFVSFVIDDSANWRNVDGSPEGTVDAIDRLPEPAQPAITSSWELILDRLVRFSDKSIETKVEEGGFIEIESHAADSPRERFDFAEGFEDGANSKQMRERSLRDAFWFDFGDARLDLLLDSRAVQDLAEEQAADADSHSAEEAWLLDDGGMIVLTGAQFIERAAEVASDDTSNSSTTSETPVGEIDIPMDAGIEMFQAIEVASAPIGQEDAIPAVDNSPAQNEGDATADDSAPPAEQAARSSDRDQPAPVRAASMSLLLALSAIFSRNRPDRKKVADRQRKA